MQTVQKITVITSKSKIIEIINLSIYMKCFGLISAVLIWLPLNYIQLRENENIF